MFYKPTHKKTRHWLHWLCCFARLHFKIHWLLLTMLIFENTCKIVSSLTMLTTPIFKNRWIVILSMTTRTKLVFQTVKSYADFTDFWDCLENNFITDCSEYPAFQDYMKNSFITACTDYADFCDYAKNGFIMDCFDYADIQHF